MNVNQHTCRPVCIRIWGGCHRPPASAGVSSRRRGPRSPRSTPWLRLWRLKAGTLLPENLKSIFSNVQMHHVRQCISSKKKPIWWAVADPSQLEEESGSDLDSPERRKRSNQKFFFRICFCWLEDIWNLKMFPRWILDRNKIEGFAKMWMQQL